MIARIRRDDGNVELIIHLKETVREKENNKMIKKRNGEKKLSTPLNILEGGKRERPRL